MGRQKADNHLCFQVLRSKLNRFTGKVGKIRGETERKVKPMISSRCGTFVGASFFKADILLCKFTKYSTNPIKKYYLLK